MSKELTDKWKAEKLKQAFYYLKFPDMDISEIYTLYDMERFRYVKDSDKIEVLAPVPSYEEYKQVNEDVDKLSDLLTKTNKGWEKTIKENKKLQEQLKDAEEALRFYDSKDFHYEVDGVVMGAEPAHKYKIKWGVK